MALAVDPGRKRAREAPPSFLTCSVVPVPILLHLVLSTFWGSQSSPGADSRKGAHLAGHGLSLLLPVHRPWPSLFSALSPQGAPGLFSAGDGQCGLRLHWLGPSPSKSYLIPLLRRLRGYSWHRARVLEAFKPRSGEAKLNKSQSMAKPTLSRVLLGHEWWREGR